MKQGKKIISLLLAFVMVCSLLPTVTPTLAAELSSYTGVTSFAEGKQNLIIDTSSRGITYTYKDEYVSIKTTDANDPYFTVNVVDASLSGKIMAIKYRGTVGTSISNPWLYPDTTAGGWGPAAGGVLASSKMTCDGVWNLTTYNISKELMGSSTSSVGTSTQLNATITSMRIGAASVAGKTVDVAYIGIFDSVAQAQEYDDLFCKVYTDVQSGRTDVVPHGLHYVPIMSYDFQESAVTNGLALVGSTTNINAEFNVKKGTGASAYVVDGTNKYLKLQYDSIQVNKLFNHGCAYAFSADVKPEDAAGHFAGFVFNYGYEKDWIENKFYESNKLDGENSVGRSGISVNIHPAMIEVCVMTYNASSSTLSQIKYTHTLGEYINGAFHKFSAMDDGSGNIRFALDGDVFAYVTYENPGLLPSSSTEYNERYYRTATIYDANGTQKATTSDALVSYVKSMAIGSRYRALNIDNVYLGYSGATEPSIALNTTVVKETESLTATVKYGEYVLTDLYLNIYNEGDKCGSGMGTVKPLHSIKLTSQKTVTLPKLSAGNYYAVIVNEKPTALSNKVSFTVTDVAKTSNIYVGDAETDIGGTVKVPVVLGSNPGIKDLTVNVSWDSSALTPVGATNGIVMGNASFSASKTLSSYTLTWKGTSNVTSTGNIAYIEFAVNNNAKLGDNAITVKVSSASSTSNDITSSLTAEAGNVKVKDTTLKIDGTTLSISSDITIKYLLKKDIFDSAGYSSPYLEAVIGGTKKIIEGQTSSVGGIACYVFSFEEVSPQMMNDVIYTTLKATKDGETCLSQTKEYSVATYIYSQLEKTTDPTFKTLLTDMLNYGASAQIYKNYKTNNLVNEAMTKDQQKYSTDELRELTTVKEAPVKGANDKATWVGMGLFLDNKVAIRGYFDTDSVNGVYVKITNANDVLLGSVTEENFTTATGPAGTPVYAFTFDGLGVSKMSEKVKITVCDSQGKAISGTYVYSIESYVYTAKDSTNAKLSDLTVAMIKYGDAAVKYLKAQSTVFEKLSPADIGTNFYANISIGGKSIGLSDTNVVITEPSVSANQLWKFVRQENGAYRIINEGNNKCLTVNGAGLANETNVLTSDASETLAQNWYLYIVEGAYIFRPAHSDNMAMDVYMADYTNGTNIQIYESSSAQNQLFSIINRKSEGATTDSALDKSKTYRILFIGNSFTNTNTMSDTIFPPIVKSAGYNAEIHSVTKGSWTLEQFANPSDTYGAKVEAQLKSYKFDYVVIQEQSNRPISNPNAFYTAVRKLDQKIKANGAKTILYATWGYKQNNPSIGSYGGTTEKMEANLRAAYTKIANEIGAEVAHVGKAFTYTYKVHPSIELYQTDYLHPSHAGSTLAAYVIFATIFNYDPRLVENNGAASAHVAGVLKTVAYDVVLGSLST